MVERVRRVRAAEPEEVTPTKVTKGTKAAKTSLDNEIDGTVAEIDKRYGAGIIGSASRIKQPLRISTGSFMLDFCTLGGIPTNRISKIVGHKHAGKSMLSDKIIGSAQRMFPEGRVVKMDLEGTHEPVWSARLGVDNDELLLAHPETGEAALDMADALIRTKEVSLLVVDCLAQIVPAKEIESSAEDNLQIGLQARMIGSFVRKAVSAMIAERHRGHLITMLFINQFRSKIGGWSPTGDPLTEPGGKSLGFAYSLEITMKNKENAGKDTSGVDTMVENEHSFKIEKNKLNSGPRTGEFRLVRVDDDDLGLSAGDIDDAGTMLAYAKKFGVYTGGGKSWTLSFWDYERKFGNANEAVRCLYENPDEYWLLRNFLISEQARRLGMPDDFIESFYTE